MCMPLENPSKKTSGTKPTDNDGDKTTATVTVTYSGRYRQSHTHVVQTPLNNSDAVRQHRSKYTKNTKKGGVA